MMHDNDKNGVRKGSIFVSTSGVLGESDSGMAAWEWQIGIKKKDYMEAQRFLW